MKLTWNGYAHRALNIMVGCSNTGCPCRVVCWARRNAKRVGAIIGCEDCTDFTPHVHLERLKQLSLKGKPKIIALNFMADWLAPEFREPSIKNPTVEQVSRMLAVKESDKAIAALSQHHTFLTLTKNYRYFAARVRGMINLDGANPDNMWFGVSITGQADMEAYLKACKNQGLPHPEGARIWISFEPLLEYIDSSLLWKLPRVHQIVIGAQTRPSVDVPSYWIGNIINYAQTAGTESGRMPIPVFVKDNLRKQYKDSVIPFGDKHKELAWVKEQP